jgi:cytidine deaminase
MGSGAAMSGFASVQADDLVAAAVAAAGNAYAPYSNFHVGTALLLDDGSIVTGTNFENASYGMTLCAETVAIAKANSDGQLRQIVAIAVAGGPAGKGPGVKPITPCGRCRQIIKEVADLTQIDLPIHCAHAGGHVTYRLSELLPHGFGPSALG